MINKFKEVEKIYKELKEKKERGEITKDEFVAELQKLIFKDEYGRYWALGITSGKWHYHDGSRWIPAKPPYQDENVIICPYCGFANPENSLICIKCEKELQKPAEVTCPRCGKEIPDGAGVCPYCNFILVKPKESEEIVFKIKRIHEFSFAIFLGGAGLVLGIIFGALIGVLSSFPFFDFFPETINATRGHFMGALIFGVGGAISGFLSLSISGLLISIFTNSIIFLFGSPKIKISRKD
ncbi:MAG: zinc-ribbon domain-containing protein [Candidatus Aminicenantia bacterium]